MLSVSDIMNLSFDDIRKLSDRQLLEAYMVMVREGVDSVRFYNLQDAVLQRMSGWKSIALHLANCEAATAEDFAMRKSASKMEKKRHASICEDILKMFKVGEMFGHIASAQDFVENRLADAVVKLRK
jgi:hypothetical protein